jgi:hypothetical protein
MGSLVSAKSAHLSYVLNSSKNMPGGHTRKIINSRRNLKVSKYLRGEVVQRKNRGTKLLKIM